MAAAILVASSGAALAALNRCRGQRRKRAAFGMATTRSTSREESSSEVELLVHAAASTSQGTVLSTSPSFSDKAVLLHRFDPQLHRPYGNKSISPFGIKVEAFLRFCNIDYETPPFSIGSILANPKRKLPTLEVENRLIADSSFIVHYLYNESPRYGNMCRRALCDDDLSRYQHAVGTAIKALCEDRLYWIVGYWRYLWTPGFDAYRQINTTSHFIPRPVRWLVDWLAWRGISNQLWEQGTGRYTQYEVEAMGREAVDVIDALLVQTNGKYLFGDMPSTYDATIFASLSSIVEIPIESPLKQYTMEKECCMKFLDSINETYWTEYDEKLP